MFFIYYKEKDFIKKIEFQQDEKLPKNILWLDFCNFNKEEMLFVKKYFCFKLPNENEIYNIEESARYYEDENNIVINNVFINKDSKNNTSITKDTLTLVLNNNILFTLRNKELPSFNTVASMILANPKHFNSGFDILNEIFDVRVDKDGDILELIDTQSRKLRMDILEQKQTPDYDFFLEKISNLQDLNMQVRFSLFEKKKTISSLIKSDKININIKENLDIILKDLNSYIEFNMSLLGILDNIQNILTNKINIEQNKIIKLFTVVTTAMMPPTLIGTIYGMNFENMPELKSEYGYFIALIAMVLSTILPIIFFKKKAWL